jgi:hypothetical protein
MELKVLGRKIATLREILKEARQVNFQGNVDDFYLLKTQQSNLLAVKEILLIFEEVKRGEMDTLDFLVTSDSHSDLLQVFLLIVLACVANSPCTRLPRRFPN